MQRLRLTCAQLGGHWLRILSLLRETQFSLRLDSNVLKRIIDAGIRGGGRAAAEGEGAGR